MKQKQKLCRGCLLFLVASSVHGVSAWKQKPRSGEVALARATGEQLTSPNESSALGNHSLGLVQFPHHSRDEEPWTQRRERPPFLPYGSQPGDSQRDYETGGSTNFHDSLKPASKMESGKLHRLSRWELSPILSVNCLRAKQKDPHVDCRELSVVPEDPSIGNYPSWNDPRCRSNGALLCDLNEVLPPQNRSALAVRLRHFYDRTVVTCGYVQSKLTGTDQHFYQHFNLGVVLLKDWPMGQTDEDTLKYFGRVLMTRWGMMPVYNGANAERTVDSLITRSEYYQFCPNAALMIVLPDYDIAYLYTPSCEFLCEGGLGSVVGQKVLAMQHPLGIGPAVEAGIDEVRRVLDEATPLSVKDSRPHFAKEEDSLENYLARSTEFWVWSQRFLVVCVVVFACLGCSSFLSNTMLKPLDWRDRQLRRLQSQV